MNKVFIIIQPKLGLHLDVEPKKNNTSESVYKAETDRYRKQIYGQQKGQREEGEG